MAKTNNWAALDGRIKSLEPAMLKFLAQFCAIPTVNPPGRDYGTCVAFLEAKLKSLGLSTRVVDVPTKDRLRLVPGSEKFPRSSLIARWDVGARQTLLLTGHYDVVPATGGWKTDPFTLVRRGRQVLARGAADMKGADTAAIFAIEALKRSGIRPEWNIELAFTPDEETGGYAGLGWLARTGEFKHVDAAILLEGASGRCLGYAHRGVLWLKITVIGKAGHAANPSNGINAFEKAMGLISQLKTLDPIYAKRQSRFRTNTPVAGRPTLMIGGVSGGGEKINTIPDRFFFTIDRRLRPEDDVRQVKAEIMAIIRRCQKRDRKLKVQVEYPLHVESGSIEPDEMICRTAAEAVREATGKKAIFRMTGGFTDMHFLSQDAKIPTVMYGAEGGGNVHGDGEYQSIDGLLTAARVYARVIEGLPQ